MIENKPQYTGDQRIDDLRAAVEHRATWFYLMYNEAKKRGLDDSFARDAILSCGTFHGQTKFPKTEDMHEFTKAFTNDNVVKMFEMDVKVTDDTLDVDFHYCPLVAAWQKLGIDEKTIDTLCDIAMDGDRGIANEYDCFDFTLGKTIAQGNPVCEIRFKKVK